MVSPAPFETVLTALKAAGEPTRLRLLAILAEGELNVTDLTEVLGQSQPRISRHLKLLAEAGLVRRSREGAWAFFRLDETGPGGAFAASLAAWLDLSDPVLAAYAQQIAAAKRLRWIGYLSTIGVYGDHGGKWVDEHTPATPTNARSIERAKAEQEWLAFGAQNNIAVQIFRAMLENGASFFGAQMSAMDNATRNAGEMIRKLTLDYNRQRQAQITKELIEIISGAEAL